MILRSLYGPWARRSPPYALVILTTPGLAGSNSFLILSLVWAQGSSPTTQEVTRNDHFPPVQLLIVQFPEGTGFPATSGRMCMYLLFKRICDCLGAEGRLKGTCH